MRGKQLFCALIASFVLLATVAMPAVAAVKLPVQTAGNKAFLYARHTCAHDVHCVKYGVTNCNRQSLHVIFCRMYLERSTPAQGHYTCQKLVRVVLDPITYRVVVTGTSGFNCR